MDQNSREPAHSTALNACRFSSIMAVAMTMSAAVAHLMELPAKMQYEPPLYVRLHRTLYPTFGKPRSPAVLTTATASAVGRMNRGRSDRGTRRRLCPRFR